MLQNPSVSRATSRSLPLFSDLRTISYVVRLLNARVETTSSLIRRCLSSCVAFLFGPLRLPQLRRWDRDVFVVRRIHILASGLVLLKLISILVRKLTSRAKLREARRLRAQLAAASQYNAWADAAEALDRLEGRRLPKWLETRGTSGLRERTTALRRARETGDLAAVAFTLRQDSTRRIGSLMVDAAEESKCRILRPPKIVEEYIEEVKEALRFICTSTALHYHEKLSFAGELRHAYGRTALVLSGGGSFGFFHFGVIRALFDAGLLPRVVSGSSAGSIGAALLCTRSDEELKDYLDSFADLGCLDFYGKPKGFFGSLRHLVTKGTLHAAEEYVERLKRLMGVETTFAEAFARSGRVLNVAIVAADTREPSRLLNYLTAPNVVIWSAVACSSAFPFLFAPQDLLSKDSYGRIVPLHTSGTAGTSISSRRWCDGSLEEDLPMRGLSEMFSVNFFLCSQTNPWLVPVLNAQSFLPPWLRRMGEYELKHRLHQLLQIWPNSRILKLLAQPWRGDLNFVLPANLFQPLKSATNFTSAEIHLAMKEGMRSVWAKLAAVRAACAIEYLIDEELCSLAVKAREEAMQRSVTNLRGYKIPKRKGIPSWLDLKSLGLPLADSREELPSLESTANDSLNSIQEDRDADTGANSIPEETSISLDERGLTEHALEKGIDAWRDMTALSMQAEGIDVVAP